MTESRPNRNVRSIIQLECRQFIKCVAFDAFDFLSFTQLEKVKKEKQ